MFPTIPSPPNFFKRIGAAISKFLTKKVVSWTLTAATVVTGVKGFRQMSDMLSKGQDIMANKTAAGGKIPVIYGTRKVGAQIVYMDTAQNRSKDLFVVYAISVGECEEILGRTIEIDGNSILDGNIYKGGGYVGSDKISSGAGSLNTASQVGDNQYSNAGTLGTDPTLRYSFVFNLHHGASSQTADPMLRASIPNDWTTNHKLNGICYIAASFDYDKKGMYKGVPQITVQVRGKKVFDPRNNSTAWSSNPALCFLDYIQSDEYGKGLATSQINMTTISAAANKCDTLVDQPYYNGNYQNVTWSGNSGDDFIVINDNADWWQNKVDEVIDIRDASDNNVITGKSITGSSRHQFYDSTQENRLYIDDTLSSTYTNEAGSARAKVKRFHCNGVINTNNSVMENAKDLLSNMRGIFTYIDGKYELQVEDTGTSSFNITSDHIIEDAGISVDYGNKDKRANKVVVEFYNANNNYELDTATVLHSASPHYYSDDGEILEIKAEFPLVTDPYIAYNLGKAILTRSRYQTSIQFLGTPELYKTNVGDIVNLEYLPLNYDGINDLFRIEALELQANGLVSVSMIQYFDVYTWQVPSQESTTEILKIPTIGALKPPQASSIVFTDTDASSINRPTLTWTEPTDFPVRQYRVDVVDSSDNNVFSKIVDTPSVDLAFLPKAANYEASITSFNGVGIESNASTKTFTIADDPVKTTEVEMNGVTLSTVETYGTVTNKSGNWVKFLNKTNFGEVVEFDNGLIVDSGTARFENAPTFVDGFTGQGTFEISQGSIQFGSYTPSTTTNRLYNVGGSLYWNGQALGTGTGDITAVVAGTNLNGGGTSGSVTLNLDSTITGDHTFSNNIIIQGNLTVQGTTTSVNTDDLNVKDKNITLNYSTGDSSASANGAGITIQDAVSASQDATLTWNTANDSFNFSHNLNFAANIKAQFGTGNDLQIYHNGSNSYIKDGGTGELLVQSNLVAIQNAAGSENMAKFIQDGAVQLYYDDSKKLETTSTGVEITGNLDSPQISINDYISHNGDSNTYFGFDSADTFALVTGGTTAISADANATYLRYQGSAKLATTSTGIDVTGTTTTDGLTINSGDTSSFLTIRNGSNSSFTKLYSDLNGVTILDVDANNVGSAPRFQIDVSEVQALRITEGGDISFYDDTGSTQALFWDASAESLCLGNTSAGAKFDIRQDSGYAIRAENNLGSYFRVAAGGNTEIGGNVTLSSTAPLLYLTNTTSGTGKAWRFSSASNGKLYITQEGVIDAVTLDHTTGNATFAGTITGDGLTVAGSNANLILGTTGNDITFTRNGDNYIHATGGTSSNIIINPQNRFVVNTGGSERLRVDSSGNFLVGKTSSDFSVYGLELVQTGVIRSTVGNGHSLLLNRKDSDGEIINLRKDNTTVGSIGARSGALYIESATANFSGLDFESSCILPRKSGSLSNGAVSLGLSSYKFSDLHLSGTANVNTIASTGDLTLDAVTNINLDADGGFIVLKDGGVTFGALGLSGGNFLIKPDGVDQDIVFNGNDGGSAITALTLDMSEGGNATFNGTITSTGLTIDNEYTLPSASGSAGQVLKYPATGSQVIWADDDTQGTTINNNADNRIITGSGTANTLNAEANFTYDGSKITTTSDSILGTTFTLANTNGNGGREYTLLSNATGNFYIYDDTANTTRLTIDSLGSILVGKTAEGTATDGIELNRQDVIVATRNGDAPLILNRRTSDGDIAVFRKDNTAVGSIGTQGGVIRVGSGNNNLGFFATRLQPLNSSGVGVDGTIDLGYSTSRFKDLRLSGNAYIGSSAYAQYFGSSADTNTLIQFAGSDDIRFRAGGTEQMRIKTTGVGIGTSSVIGKLHANDSAGATLTLTRTSGATSGNLGKIRFGNTDIDSDLASIVAIQDGATNNSALTFGTQTAGYAVAERMRITSAGRLGLGTDSPTVKLEIQENTNSTDVKLRLRSFNSSSAGRSTYIAYNPDTRIMGFGEGGDEVNIDQNGNLLVGKTSTNFAVAGTQLAYDGAIVATRSANPIVTLNRLSTDGEIQRFFKDGTQVGSIGVDSTDNLYIAGGSGSTKGIYFNDAGVIPATTGGGVVDNAVDLGQSGYRFKNLYLSGSTSTGDLKIGSTTVINGARSLTNIASANVAGNITIDYTGNSTNDAGLFVQNDSNDWGIRIQKTSTNSYGMQIRAGGDYVFRTLNSSGIEKFRIDGDGDIETVRNINSTGDINSSNVQINSNGIYLLNGDYRVGSTAIVDSSRNLVNIGNITASGIANVAGGIQNTQPTNGFGYLNFGDTDDANVGQIGYDHSSNYMRFQVNNTEKVRIDSGGNLMVGTTTSQPGTKLQVAGVFDVWSSSNTLLRSRHDGTRGIIETFTGGAYANTVINPSGGNIGIGEVLPEGKLHIKGGTATGNASHVLFENTQGSKVFAIGGGASGVTNNNLYIRNVTDNTTPMVITDAGNATFAGAITTAKNDNTFTVQSNNAGQASVDIKNTEGHFRLITDAGTLKVYDQTDSSERFRIDTSGNVGIKNSNPTATLTVGTLSSGQTGNVVINNEGGNTATLEVLSRTNRSILKVADNDTTGYISAENGLFSIGRNSGNNSANINIDSSNRVGIGTNSPSHLLSVGTEGNSSGKKISLYLGGTNGNYSAIGAQRAEDNTYCQSEIRFINENNSSGLGAFAIATGNNNLTERMRIDSSGRLIVGGTTAGETNATTIYPTGNITSGSITATGSGVFNFNKTETYNPVITANDSESDTGQIIAVQIGGTTKGNIGISGTTGNDMYIASGTTSSAGFGLRFIDYTVTNAALPCRGDGSTVDNLMDLGNSGSRFDDIYATNGTINTSDRNEKQDIQALTEAEQRVATACKGLIRRFRWQDAVEKKGDDARYHFGVIAQDLQDAFEAEGLDAGDYGMFISSTWTDDDGNEKTRLGVRYNELLAFIITTL